MSSLPSRLNLVSKQVHGIREFAAYKDAQTCYIPATAQGGFDISTAKVKF
jgi:hypothetical protein